MRILMVSDVYFPRVNGVSTSIQTFRQDLIGLGHACRLIAPQYLQAPHLADDTDIARIPSWQVPRDPEDRAFNWSEFMRSTSQLRPEDVDVVHIQTPFLAH